MTLIPNTALHTPHPAHLYCGPAALVAVTGLDYLTKIRPAINRALGRRENRPRPAGMSWRAMEATLAAFGYAVEPLGDYSLISWPAGNCLTLTQFAASLTDDLPRIVCVTGHYVALHRNTVVDNRVPLGAPVAEHPSARCRVRASWAITPKETSK